MFKEWMPSWVEIFRYTPVPSKYSAIFGKAGVNNTAFTEANVQLLAPVQDVRWKLLYFCATM